MSKGQGGEFTLRGPQGRELSRTVEPRLCASDLLSDSVIPNSAEQFQRFLVST